MSESVRTFEESRNLNENQIIGFFPIMNNSEIVFNGKDNVLYCEEGVRLGNSKIHFNGDNSLLYLSKNKNEYFIHISAFNNTTLYIGEDNYINPTEPLHIILSEERSVLIGRECLFSFDIWIRTADPHLVYSAESHRRVNPSKSIYIGDHVWVGQSVIILKGTKIHSGSIIGAMSLVAGKMIPSNESWGGNPLKQLSKDIFWSGESVHKWREEQTKKHEVKTTNKYIFSQSNDSISYNDIDESLFHMPIEHRIVYLQSLSKKKNRFARNLRKKSPIKKIYKRVIMKLKGKRRMK